MAPDLADLRHWLPIATVPCYFLVAWTFFRRGLWRSYPFFCVCILVEGIALAVGLWAGDQIKLARLAYIYSQPPLWILYILSVLEVFQKVFAKFPGIARFAKRVIWISILVAFVFALSSIGGDLSTGWTGASIIRRYTVIMRVISSALSLYLILIALFLAWMPVPLPPNTIRHSFLFFFYFLVATGVHYVINTSPGAQIQQLNAILSLLTLGALIAWLVLLRPAGEELPGFAVAPRTSSSTMLDRLEALNRALSKR